MRELHNERLSTNNRNRWGLYVERMTVWDPQVHSRTQASSSLLHENKMLPPNGLLTSGTYDIVNVVNKRKNCTRSGRHLGPSSSSSFCYCCWDGAGYQLGCAASVARLAQALFTTWRAQLFFFCLWKWLAHHFLVEYPTSADFFFSALLGYKSFKTTRDTFGLAIKKAVNFISNMKWAVNI
jgi:hypothetical protein